MTRASALIVKCRFDVRKARSHAVVIRLTVKVRRSHAAARHAFSAIIRCLKNYRRLSTVIKVGMCR